jgi:hypothetical protein
MFFFSPSSQKSNHFFALKFAIGSMNMKNMLIATLFGGKHKAEIKSNILNKKTWVFGKILLDCFCCLRLEIDIFCFDNFWGATKQNKTKQNKKVKSDKCNGETEWKKQICFCFEQQATTILICPFDFNRMKKTNEWKTSLDLKIEFDRLHCNIDFRQNRLSRLIIFRQKTWATIEGQDIVAN